MFDRIYGSGSMIAVLEEDIDYVPATYNRDIICRSNVDGVVCLPFLSTPFEYSGDSSIKDTIKVEYKSLIFNFKDFECNYAISITRVVAPADQSKRFAYRRDLIKISQYSIVYGSSIMFCIFVKNNVIKKRTYIPDFFTNNLSDNYPMIKRNMLFYFNRNIFIDPSFRKLTPFMRSITSYCVEHNFSMLIDDGQFIRKNFLLNEKRKNTFYNEHFLDRLNHHVGRAIEF